MRVCNGVDPNDVAEHAICEHEREPANDALADAELGAHAREWWARQWERSDQPDAALNGCVETLAATRSLGLVVFRRCVELVARTGANSTRFTSVLKGARVLRRAPFRLEYPPRFRRRAARFQ